jgi:hypothetical protein
VLARWEAAGPLVSFAPTISCASRIGATLAILALARCRACCAHPGEAIDYLRQGQLALRPRRCQRRPPLARLIEADKLAAHRVTTEIGKTDRTALQPT